MNKNISQKLCEECKLEPKIIRYECAKGMGFNRYTNACPVYVMHKCPNWNSCRYEQTMKPVYAWVNFENSNNFVKLLNLIIFFDIQVMFDYKHNINHTKTVSVGDIDGESLVDALYNYITSSYEYYEFEDVEQKVEALKKAIREESWEV